MTYFDKLKRAKAAAVRSLKTCGVRVEHLSFGGPAAEPEKQPRVPVDARSEFLANRAMGDWAEKILAAALRQYLPSYSVSHYGNAEPMAAGHPNFKAFYLTGLEEVRKHGKRPDLLIFPKTANVPTDLTTIPFKDVDTDAAKAIASIEVRSSKFEAFKYIEARKQQKASGKKNAGRQCPSFTVKVEDLVIVYRWLERMQIPQAYFQVFFDSVFSINFLDIFSRVGEGDIEIETPAKSQEKATIMIPITAGIQVGKLHELPKFAVEHRVTELGRHDAYVRPEGGKLELFPDAVANCLGLKLQK